MNMEPFNPHISIPIPYNFAIAGNNGVINFNPSNILCNHWLDPRIWSRLPNRLVDRVIAFLPPQAFFRFRVVCKRWYGLLFSNNFLELYLQVSPSRHWFIFFKQKSVKNSIYLNDNGVCRNDRSNFEGYLFDPYEITWFRVSFPLIPSGFSPASSSGGLVSWVSDGPGCKNILLANPLLGSLTALPSTLRPRLFPSVGLSITNSSIDVAVAGDDLISPYAVKNLSSESFHIDTGGFYSIWGTSSTLPRLCSLESGRLIYVEGGSRFYCMNYSPFSVLCYDISTNQWSKIQAPMRRFLQSPTLVECNGKLILVASVEKSKLNVPKSLRLWSLQECGTLWVEIERMPQQLYLQFSEVEGGQGFHCVGHGQFLVIFINGGPSSDKAVMFDFCKKRWQWIPPCPYVVYDSAGGGGSCYSYGGSGGGGGGGGNCYSNGGGDGGGGGGICYSNGDQLHGFAYEPRIATPVTSLLDQLTLPFQSFSV